MIPTVPVTVTFFAQNGQPLAGAKVSATLTRTELYNGFVVSNPLTVVSDANGVAVLNIFPNQLGSQGSQYIFKLTQPGGQTLSVTGTVPNAACTLQSIIAMPASPAAPIGQVAVDAAIAAMGAAHTSELAAAADVVLTHADVVSATAQAAAAAGSAGIATTQAGIATTQAGIATTQAGIATTQATAAAGSATAAAGSAALIAGKLGQPSGIATLDAAGKVPLVQIPAGLTGGLACQGAWNASTNAPPLASGVGVKGDYYVVSVAGATNLDGNAVWSSNDLALFSGTAWNIIQGGINQAEVLAALGYTPENPVNRDALGGYPSLIGYALKLWNAGRTFYSTLMLDSAAAANVVHTLQPRSGTLADNTDLSLKAPISSPSLTGIVTMGSGNTGWTVQPDTSNLYGALYSKKAAPAYNNHILQSEGSYTSLNSTVETSLTVLGSRIAVAAYSGGGIFKINGQLSASISLSIGVPPCLLISATAPTIASGFGATPAILANNTHGFKITVGTGGAASGVITLPAAPNGWRVAGDCITDPTIDIKLSGSSPTSATIAAYRAGVATTFPAGGVLILTSQPY